MRNTNLIRLGQTQSWTALVPFVQITRERAIEKFSNLGFSGEALDTLVENEVREDVRRGIQTYQYQVITMSSANGQSPFISAVLNLREAMTTQEQKDLAMIIEEVLKQRLQGVKNKDGRWISPLFPKLLYVLCDGLNVNEGDPYYYLTELAARCEVKRMQPDIISEKVCREAKEGMIIPSMGCRSILTPYWRKRIYKQNINSSLIESGDKYNVELDSIRRFGLNSELLAKPDKDKICLSLKPISLIDMYVGDREFEDHTYLYNYLGNTGWITKMYRKDDYIYVETKEPKWYGRWNQGVVTLNIPYVALLSKAHSTDFFEELDKASEIVRHALRERHNSILNITAKNAPILWQYGALARLDSEDKLNSMLDEDVEYTTISYGYVGLYETCMCLLGKSNTTKEGQAFSIEILEHINNLLDKWKKEDKIPYSIYGTPEEQTTEKFARALKNNFVGITIPGVNDHDYVTNSYHVNPSEPISAFDKLAIEGKFLNLSKGGAVSYIECSSALEKNTKAIETVFKFMYDNILYSELNFTNEDYCENCGYQGELILDDTNGGKFLFHCPHCGCHDATKLHATRRLCGYIGEVANGIGQDSPNANQGRLADIYARVKHI